MKYMVISKTLRKSPSGVAVDRVCTKYTIKPELPSDKTVYLEINSVIWIPIFALHRDPKYFPEPERFDPERFNGHIRIYRLGLALEIVLNLDLLYLKLRLQCFICCQNLKLCQLKKH